MLTPVTRDRRPRLIGIAALAVLAAGAVAAAGGTSAPAAAPAAEPPRRSEFRVQQPLAEPLPASAPVPAVTTAAAAPASLPPLPGRKVADVLVTGAEPLTPAAVSELSSLAKGGALAFRAGTVTVQGKPVPTVGVDPDQFRAFAADGTAQATAVWQAVARGEAVASHAAAEQLGVALGDTLQVTPAGGGPAVPVRLAALATTGLPATDLVVDDALGAGLGLTASTGLLLAGEPDGDPVALANQVREVTGDAGVVDLLSAPMSDPTAFLTGGSAAKAFGAFSYEYFPDGTIAPDAQWVRDNIRTEVLPIMGRVTCHRLMLPQLRGALEEVQARGLAGTLRTFDGCYVPRFIERNPSRSISLHTWGIAIDMDASTNYRGIRGTMDPKVVEVFKRWGFRWGGDWAYTDPMHFELGAVLQR